MIAKFLMLFGLVLMVISFAQIVVVGNWNGALGCLLGLGVLYWGSSLE